MIAEHSRVLVAVPDDPGSYPVAHDYRGCVGRVLEVSEFKDELEGSPSYGQVFEAALVEFADGRTWYVETRDLIPDPSHTIERDQEVA